MTLVSCMLLLTMHTTYQQFREYIFSVEATTFPRPIHLLIHKYVSASFSFVAHAVNSPGEVQSANLALPISKDYWQQSLSVDASQESCQLFILSLNLTVAVKHTQWNYLLCEHHCCQHQCFLSFNQFLCCLHFLVNLELGIDTFFLKEWMCI